MNLVLSEMSPRRALWMGLLVSVAFRVFAYGIVWIFPLLVDWHSPISFRSGFGSWIACAAIIGFPVATAFVAGFLGAYYWRRVPLLDCIRSILIANIILLGVVCVAANLFRAEIAIIFAFVGFIDTAVCLIGNEKGGNFWGGELARQFIGDFSVRDEDD